MTDEATPKAKEGRRPTALDPDEMAAILAYAKLHGLEKAAEKFSVSERTIIRWRAKVRDGQAPELAALVAKQQAIVAERRVDAICDTLDELLDELKGRKKKLQNTELIEAVEKVGSLRVSRDALMPIGLQPAAGAPRGEPPRADQSSARSAARAGQGAGGPARAPEPAGAAGGTAGAGSGTDPVH